jgi:hypothetical protein
MAEWDKSRWYVMSELLDELLAADVVTLNPCGPAACDGTELCLMPTDGVVVPVRDAVTRSPLLGARVVRRREDRDTSAIPHPRQY